VLVAGVACEREKIGLKDVDSASDTELETCQYSGGTIVTTPLFQGLSSFTSLRKTDRQMENARYMERGSGGRDRRFGVDGTSVGP
jgi:hypothetical protein